MANLINKWEGSASGSNDYFSNISDGKERFYTTCLIKVEGLEDKQNIHIRVKSVIGNDEELLFKTDMEIAKKEEVFGPILINKKCKLVIDGNLDCNLIGNARCKIETNICYDETSIETLRIGVFFDGTGNNAYNSQEGSESEASIIQKNGMIIPASYLLTERHSHNANVSNIWRLYSSFNDGRINDSVYQIKTYVEGIGTKKGESDSRFTFAAGWSLPFTNKTGVIDKTDDAIKQIKEIIETLDGNFDNIEFCIFGFSRGAAAARHFANRINKLDSKILELFKSKNLKIKFMGLFDTVASIFALSEFDFDIGDSKTGAVDITLKENISHDIFHITAGHELRENFSLNHITKNYQTELELPGVHSDIGGGYHDNVKELLNISQVLYDEVGDEVDNEETSSYKVAQKKLNELLKHPMWGGIYKVSDVKISTTKSKMSGPFVLYSNVINIERDSVRTGLDRVSFQAMRYYASKCGMAFNILPSNIVENIPNDLEHLHKQACLQVDSIYSYKKSASLASSITPNLGAKYIHQSFFFDEDPSNYVVDHESILDSVTYKLLLTNRPHENYSRRQFNADGTNYS